MDGNHQRAVREPSPENRAWTLSKTSSALPPAQDSGKGLDVALKDDSQQLMVVLVSAV